MEKMSGENNKSTENSGAAANKTDKVEVICPVENPNGASGSCQDSGSGSSKEALRLVEEGSAERTEQPVINNSPLPVLDLEQYDGDIEKEATVEEQASGSVRYAWIGTGQCGARLVKSFYDLGCKKVLAVDTAREDLDLLDIPADYKFQMATNERQKDTDKDTERGRRAIQQHQQEILHLARQRFGTGVDHIMVCFGAGGGTGGGSIFGLIEVAKRYARYIGLDNPNKNVGVVMTLPAWNMGRPSAASNAFEVATRLGQMASAGKISPLIIIDNSNVRTVSQARTSKSLWSSINDDFASLFETFNRLSARSSAYTSFDPIEYRGIMEAGGCVIMGRAEVDRFDDPFAISEAVKNNFEKTPLAGGFDLSTAKQAGCVVVGGKELMANVKGLQNNVDYAFDVLSEITGNATIHRGIYEDGGKRLKVCTIIGGLASPAVTLEELNDRQRCRPDIAHLEGLPLCERKEDIVPLAEYFLAEQGQVYNEPQKVLSTDTKKLLISYTWPGDVRQLAEAMEHAHELTTDQEVQCAAIPFEILFADFEPEQKHNLPTLERTRSQIITRALELTRGNERAVAKILGISTDKLNQLTESLGMAATV